MANKPQGKNWSEIQLAIAAVAVTATLGFWNLFSTPEKAQSSVQVIQTATPPPPPPAETAQPTATALALRPVKIIFGGKVPQQPVVQVAVAQPPNPKRRNSGGGGSSAPAPAASTGSSKP
jgi:hypothetical protein